MPPGSWRMSARMRYSRQSAPGRLRGLARDQSSATASMPCSSVYAMRRSTTAGSGSARTRASPRSLPGALWRLYLMRALIRQDPGGISLLYQRGTEVATTIDPVVAGATAPTGPAEIVELADSILRGLFTGDFAVALDRAGAFSRLAALGATSVADDLDATASPERAGDLTTRALRLSQMAADLVQCARLWRSDRLD
jgi:hypothetical protein